LRPRRAKANWRLPGGLSVEKEGFKLRTTSEDYRFFSTLALSYGLNDPEELYALLAQGRELVLDTILKLQRGREILSANGWNFYLR
jgi:hypothetical protein